MHIVCTRVTNFYCVPIFKKILGLSLFRRFREVFTNVKVGKFTKWRVKPDLLFLFSRLFEWLFLVSPTLKSAWVPLLLLLPIQSEFNGFTYFSLPWSPLFLRASSNIVLLLSKIILHEDSLLILWFTALGICFNNDLELLE